MLFNSVEFALFLPIVFALYWLLSGHRRREQNVLIIAASYLFYGWWDWRFLTLIVFTTLCSFGCGLAIERLREKPAAARWVNISNIVLNIGILVIFKYYDFFITSFVRMFGGGAELTDGLLLRVILPVGVSFYTFQALSYSIDVYRGKIAATHDLPAFMAFISFFPQLMAGPIERATNLLPQFLRERTFDPAQATDGLRQALWGFFKKMVVADNCALIADRIFSQSDTQPGLMLIIGAVAFTFQIYGDFSGYSDIAIGISRLFGFNLMRNFNLPYFSRDIAEFWRRWHISLTTWFRDYIYIPLGGSRGTRWLVFRNTLVIFLISGLWHGANWTFVVWGAYHALLFLPLILLNRNRKYTGGLAPGRMLPSVRDALHMLTTFSLAVLGWIIFRAEDIGHAWRYITRIFSPALFQPVAFDRDLESVYICAGIGVLTLMTAEWLQRDKEHALQLDSGAAARHRTLRYGIYYLLLIGTYAMHAQQQTFIYFQF